jgi:hypothetical protein
MCCAATCEAADGQTGCLAAACMLCVVVVYFVVTFLLLPLLQGSARRPPRHHHHQITKLSHSINAIGPAPYRSGNTSRWRTRIQKWPRLLKTHGICMCRVHIRNVHRVCICVAKYTCAVQTSTCLTAVQMLVLFSLVLCHTFELNPIKVCVAGLKPCVVVCAWLPLGLARDGASNSSSCCRT